MVSKYDTVILKYVVELSELGQMCCHLGGRYYAMLLCRTSDNHFEINNE